MKIFVVSQYFWPESFLINDLVRKLVEAGHEVSVFTGQPNYPDGDAYPGYDDAATGVESFEGLANIYRVPLRPRYSGGGKNLLLNYLSFIWSGLRHFPKLAKDLECDVIFVFAPSPITSAVPAILLKYLKKAHLSVWVQDLWPQSLRATGFIKNRVILKVVEGLVRLIYWQSDSLLVQSKAFIPAVAKYCRRSKVEYYPNSIAVQPEATVSEVLIPSELSELFSSGFTVVFAGNIGSAQAVEVYIEAARKLLGVIPVQLIMIGSGSMLDWAMEQKERYGLDNLHFPGRYPMEVMPLVFANSDALAVSLRNDEIFQYTVPSKIPAYLASGKPIVGVLNGEGARVINQSGGGLTCAAESSVGFISCIKDLYKMSERERDEMGRCGAAYFEENYNMQSQVLRLIEIFNDKLERGAR